MTHRLVATSLLPILLLHCASWVNGSTEAADRKTKTLLLVDDHHVLYRPGTYRVLHQPKKWSLQPLITADKPWEGMIGYCSVHFDRQTGKYQLWYQAYGGGRGGKICYAESRDGLAWTKPELDINPYKNHHKNNIVLLGLNRGKSSYGASVLFDPRDKDASRRYKMAKWEMPQGYVAPWPGLYVAFSPDGIHWSRYNHPPDGPLIHGSYGRKGPPPFVNDPDYTFGEPVSVSDVIDVSYDPVNEVFSVFAKTWIDGPDGHSWRRSVVRTASKDFIQWTKPQLVFYPDEFDGEFPGAYGGSRSGVQIHGSPTFHYKGVFFALLQVVDFEKTGEMPIELAISRDGVRWKRPFRDEPFIPLSRGRVFDSGLITSNATPVILSEEIRFYYSAYEQTWNSYVRHNKTGIGMASLPIDRFAGIRPIYEIGQITLRPIDLDGSETVTLNGDAEHGAIRVELLDEDGYRVRGFTQQDAVEITGDSLAHEVRWQGNRALQGLTPGKYMIRIHLKNSEAFAIDVH